MANRFQFSRPARRGPNDPWFRIGETPVGSAAVLACLAIVSFLVYAVEGREHPILDRLILDPSKVRDGQLWRIATWPLANQPNIWVAISIALLWLFGSRLEDLTGRTRMAGFLAAVIVIPGVVGTLLDLPQGGIRAVQFVVLLSYIAEYPFAQFFFGIPAWALGAVYVGLDVLRMVGERDGRGLLFYAVTLAVAAVAGRSIGLFERYPWIPAIPIGRRHSRPTRGHTSRPRQRRSSGARVVEGPWVGSSPGNDDAAAAQAELDGLLDKISASGLDSLTSDEKRRLNELSKRLR